MLKTCQVRHANVTEAKRPSPSRVNPRPGHRAWHLRRRYGMTEAQFDEMLLGQYGCCKVCFKCVEGRDTRGKLLAHIDHDHVTGRVRGILCITCNTAAGAVYDNPETAARLARYLEAV